MSCSWAGNAVTLWGWRWCGGQSSSGWGVSPAPPAYPGTADSRGRWRRRFPPTFDRLVRGYTSVSVTPLSGLRCTRIKHCYLHTSHICLYKFKKKNEKWKTVNRKMKYSTHSYWLNFRNCIYHIWSSSRFALLDLYMVMIFGLI